MRSFAAANLAAALAFSGCAGASSSLSRSAWGLDGRKYMVAADHPLASAAGAQILASGGNVVDAAVATSFALAVTRPYSAGLGGGGFMLIRLVGRPPVMLDYRETAPAAAIRSLYLDSQGNVIPGKTVRGRWAAGVPGQVRGLEKALQEYGTMRLAGVLKPAIRLAEKGFRVDADTHEAMAELAERVRESEAAGQGSPFAEAARIFLRDGKPYAVGEVLIQLDLAKSLRMIADNGSAAFYTGPIARRILLDMQRNAGPMTAGDLSDYAVKVREPLIGQFRGFSVLAAPPPSSGGACVLQMLNVLDRLDLKESGVPGYYHVLSESMKHAFADRAELLGDADFEPAIAADVAGMISAEHAGAIRAAIRDGRSFGPRRYGRRGIKDDSGTTHYSILDEAGNAVAATETINTRFGSLVVPADTGIVLNNELDDFVVKSGVPNEFGLLTSERNALRPGARPLSSMSPTLLIKDGRAVLAVGASGGPRIITATVQAILRIVDFEEPADAAVAAKRIHHQWSPDVLRMEDGFPADVAESLKAAGNALERYPSGAGAVQVVHAAGGKLYGASDPRKGGRPAGR